MWAGVRERFRRFHVEVVLTQPQIDDGIAKTKGIASTLNAAYHGYASETLNWLWAGSWGKQTQTRPPRDIDLFFILPDAVYYRFQQVHGNKQSQLLQEVRSKLIADYGQTVIRGDGQVVVVAFNTVTVEVLPCFNTTEGRYLICDSNNGGSYTVANPVAEIEAIQTGDILTSLNLRPVIQMLKIWRQVNSVDLKAYLMEALLNEFMQAYAYRHESYFYYDWTIRDFFAFLITRSNTYVWVPDGQSVFLGDAWKSKAESAYARSVKACDYERDDYITLAGDEWEKVFGGWIPKHVT